jgi:hypothetical protein
LLETLDRKFIFGSFIALFGDTRMSLNVTKSDIEICSTSTEKENIESLTDDVLSSEKMKVKSLKKRAVSQGQTVIHRVNVGSGIKCLDLDLDWGNKSNKLGLTAYSPSGKDCGTKSDGSDGSVDGRITCRIEDKNGGYLETGDWMFKVKGKSVSGTEDYTFKYHGHKG